MSSAKVEPIAIIGMAAVFPGAPDVDTFWRNCRAGVDAIQDVPVERWDPVFYDPESSAVDRFYCRRGGFIDDHASFDALSFGVMPVAAGGAEPDQLMTLRVASEALADAGYAGREFPRASTGVVLGRGNYIGAGMTRLEQHVRTSEQLISALRDLIPGLDPAQLARVKTEFQAQLGSYGPDTAIGLVPNLTASRVANRLDLQGPSYTVDAACASSLVAVQHACHDLQSGRANLALAGGVHLSHDVAFWSVFCQLGALSRQGVIRPFDSRADGILIGEGVGVVVLKRLADAERDDDRIHAVIRGTGVASDGRGASLMVPRVDGQLLALKRAWTEADVDPASLGYCEAHGTGTPAGDTAEVETLRRFFGTSSGTEAGGAKAGLGSVKSQIGHAMPAAGIAGLIRAALAVRDGVLPPSLHCEEPRPDLADSRFEVFGTEAAWPERDGPRRAGVNAFGFGGINGHVVLEQHAAPKSRGRRRREVDAWQLRELGAEGRLALLDPTPSRRTKAAEVVRAGEPRSGRDGVHYARRGLVAEGGKIAFLFPGVEARFEPRVDDVAAHFGLPTPRYSEATNLEEQGFGVIEVGRLLADAAKAFGLTPDVVVGHSIGEWAAMLVSGMIPAEDADDLISELVPGSLEVPGVVFVAAGCSVEKAGAAIEGLSDIAVSHDNCPHQVILCGREEAAAEARRRLAAAGVLAQELPFRSGFHSPLFADFVRPHREHLSKLRLGVGHLPMWSATTGGPFPDSEQAIRGLVLDHLTAPVRFRELIEALYADGVRVFVQMGPGSLVSFTKDTLKGRPHLAMSANVSERSGMAQLRRLGAALFAEGCDLDLGVLGLQVERPSRGGPMKLALGVPLVRLETRLEGLGAELPADSVTGAGTPVMAAFHESLAAMRVAQQDVLAALAAPPSGPSRPPLLAFEETLRLSVATHPHLVDHCFFRQRAGWPDMRDRYPVVPMTMSLSRLIAAGERAAPGRVVVALEGVRAFKWVAVEPPVDVTVEAKPVGEDRVSVRIAGYIEATAVVADAYPAAPIPVLDSLATAPVPPASARQLYADRWMFHGPGYEAVVGMEAMSDKGIRGELESLPAEGALLDAAGQLFGYWVMEHTERDRLAMPVQLERLALYGPHPAPGTRLTCTVITTQLAAREVRSNMEVVDRATGRVWARIDGWEDWRFETDDRFWEILRYPELNTLSVVAAGEAALDGVARNARSRDDLARRYLRESEREVYDTLDPRTRRAWLLGRVAAKDVVRGRLRAAGGEPLYPAELVVQGPAAGPVTVVAPGAERGLSVALDVADPEKVRAWLEGAES